MKEAENFHSIRFCLKKKNDYRKNKSLAMHSRNKNIESNTITAMNADIKYDNIDLMTIHSIIFVFGWFI